MINIEAISHELCDWLTDKNLDHNIVSVNEKSVKIRVNTNGVEVTVWYDAEKRSYGFDMLHGGFKPYETLQELGTNLVRYLDIHTDLLPKAKLIADAFEAELGIKTVYNTFQGNKQTGYTVVFNVLGQKEKTILVAKTVDGYSIKYGQYVDENKRFKILTEYKYEIIDGVVSKIPTIHSYLDELNRRYGDNDNIDLERIDFDVFDFVIEGLAIRAKVLFMYKDITYTILRIANYDMGVECKLDNPYDLSSLYMFCKTIYDDNESVYDAESTEEEPVKAESATTEISATEEAEVEPSIPDIGDSNTNSEESEAGFDDSPKESEAGFDDSHKESEAGFEDTNNSKEPEVAFEDSGNSKEPEVNLEDNGKSVSLKKSEVGYEDTNNSKESEVGLEDDLNKAEVDLEDNLKESRVDSEVTDNPKESGVVEETSEAILSVKKIVLDDKVVSLQLSTESSIFILSVDKASELGIPVTRIVDSVSCVNRFGMLVTEDELISHKFAEDITDNTEKCIELVKSIFR